MVKIEFNFIILNQVLFIIFLIALFFITIYLLLPWFFNLIVSPKFNACYIYNSKNFKKKEKSKPLLNQEQKFQIDFNNKLGTYLISFGPKRLFINGNIKIRHKLNDYCNYNTSKSRSKLLKLISITKGDRNDKLGTFSVINAKLRLEDEERYVNISIKHYNQQNFIIFELLIPEGLKNTSSDKNSELITSFPSFINKCTNEKIFTY